MKRRNPVRDPEHRKLLTRLKRHFEKDERSLRQKNPGRKVHTAKFDRCVRSVKKRLKGTSNPYAVCMAALGKKALRGK